jgi:hypothetical protein
MKRVRAICFHLLSALSFAVLCAVLALWGRTRLFGDSFLRGTTWLDHGTVYTKWYSINSYDGSLWVHRGTEQRAERPGDSSTPKVEYVHRRFLVSASGPATYEYISSLGFGHRITRSLVSRAVTGRGFIFPHWFAALVAFVLPFLWGRWLFVRLRRYDRITRGRCPDCGYELQASPERCPECGTPRKH